MSIISLPTPPQAIPLDDLESELLGLAGHIAAAECRFLQLLAEFDQRNGWAGDGIHSCAHWLSWRAGMNLRTATEHLRVAHSLRNLPRIREAFAAGQLSYSKVRAITRITGSDTATLTRLAAEIAAGTAELRDTTVADPDTAEQVLSSLARHGTASHVETVVRAVRRRHTPPENLAARRSLSWQWDEDGSLVLRARLTPDEGAALVASIEAQVPARTPVSHPVPPAPDDLEARAREQEPGPAADRLAARRADALLALVNGRTHSEAASGPVVERGRAQVIVHLDASTGTARLADGPEIPATTAERLACDARVQVLLNDRTSNRMYLGRNRRLATPAQIAALTVRDGGGVSVPRLQPHPASARPPRHPLVVRRPHGYRQPDPGLLLPPPPHPRPRLPHPPTARSMAVPPTRWHPDPGHPNAVDRQHRKPDRNAHPRPATDRPHHPHPRLVRRPPRP